MIKQENNLEEFQNSIYLSPENAHFEKTKGGFLSLYIDGGEKYDRVNLFSMFPFTVPSEYISVRTVDETEIGIIRNINEYSKKIIKYFEEELNRRYFLPEILKIKAIKDEYGFKYWDVETDFGSKQFTTKRDDNSIFLLKENRVIITDIDGNRFNINDYTKIDAKSYKQIELQL